MPGLQQKHKKSTARRETTLVVKGEVALNFFIVSEESLEQLKDISKGSINLDLSLFFFSLAIGIATTIFTTDIKSKSLFIILLVVAAILFTIGVLKYIGYLSNKKKLKKIINRIKKSRCLL